MKRAARPALFNPIGRARETLRSGMSVDSDLKAALLLEDFVNQLADGAVEYRYRAGHHEFEIRWDTSTYLVDFPDRVLLEHSIRVLEKVVPRIVRQVLSGQAPPRIDLSDATPWCCETVV